MKQFKVFYSWQSDLPRETNEKFIDKCISKSVSNCNSIVEGIEIKADRDTRGMTGSPNISETIFSKIDECDLFIADVSIVSSYSITKKLDEVKTKFSPNPNVLIELGYAVKCLGWERIICFINKDYGGPEQLPFDLGHQRVTPYSANSVNREWVKEQLIGIISDTILQLSEISTRPKKNKASHVVGSYNCIDKTIEPELAPYNIYGREWIDNYYGEKKAKAFRLIQEIKQYHISIEEIEYERPKAERIIQLGFSYDSEDNFCSCFIGENEREEIISLANELLDISGTALDNNFFNLGNLKTAILTPQPFLGIRIEPEIRGSDDEMEKYKKIKEFRYILDEMKLLDLYLKTFDNVLLFPLAIYNYSSENDSAIEVTVELIGNCEPIIPSVDFINPALKEHVVEIYKSGILKKLFYLRDGGDIKYDENEYLDYNPERPFFLGNMYMHNYDLKESEYENAIQRYIATPQEANLFVFTIKSLRAGEKKWLGRIIALRKPKNTKVEFRMRYRIISNNTSGDLEGELIYKKSNEGGN